MLTELTGLIVRVVDISDKDRLFSIFTAEKGLVTAVAKGCRDFKCRYMAACQLFCYCRFIMYRRSDKYWIKEADALETFFDLRRDIARTALASYVCDVVSDTATAEPDAAYLRLVLNTLHAFCSDKYDPELVKAAFELRCASVLGFLPDLDGCSRCGEGEGDFVLDIMNGTLVCDKCRSAVPTVTPEDEGYRRIIEIVTPTVLASMRYVCFAPLERLFSFRISDDGDRRLFCRAAENYLINHLERSFRSLQFYHEVK